VLGSLDAGGLTELDPLRANKTHLVRDVSNLVVLRFLVDSVHTIDVDERRNQPKMRRVALGDVVTQSSRKQRPTHVGEGEEQECTPPIRINRPYGRPSKEEVDDAFERISQCPRQFNVLR
jgi:hypothetical protein